MRSPAASQLLFAGVGGRRRSASTTSARRTAGCPRRPSRSSHGAPPESVAPQAFSTMSPAASAEWLEVKPEAVVPPAPRPSGRGRPAAPCKQQHRGLRGLGHMVDSSRNVVSAQCRSSKTTTTGSARAPDPRRACSRPRRSPRRGTAGADAPSPRRCGRAPPRRALPASRARRRPRLPPGSRLPRGRLGQRPEGDSLPVRKAAPLDDRRPTFEAAGELAGEAATCRPRRRRHRDEHHDAGLPRPEPCRRAGRCSSLTADDRRVEPACQRVAVAHGKRPDRP